jgi:hypothetical protein
VEREALSRQQGLVVVKLEEAKVIAGEKSLLGGEVRRIVPLSVLTSRSQKFVALW